MTSVSNVSIPSILLEDISLTLLDRSILPVVAMHSLQYGELLPGIEASKLSELLRIDINEILISLKSLTARGFINEHIISHNQKRQHFWQVGSNYIAALNGYYKPQAQQKNSILDLDLQAITDLESEALIKLHTLGLSKEIWDDWYAEAKANDLESQNFMHSFMETVNKKLITHKKSSNALSIHDSTRPNNDQFELAQFFHSKWKELYPQHQEPHNMMLEAVNLKTLEEIKGVSLSDIHMSMEWLFSTHGKWYRPNIKNCILFRKKFDYIQRQAQASSSQQAVRIPDGKTIFDMIDDEF
jgi:hypothetical protein